MKLHIMECEDGVRQSVQPSRITSASQSDVDRQDLKQYANESYLAEIACESSLSGKGAESRRSLVLDPALQKLTTTEFDRLSLLSYSSARAGTVQECLDQDRAQDLSLWRGYGETVYFDPLNAHAMKIQRPNAAGCQTSRGQRSFFQSHLGKSATSRKSGKTSGASKDMLQSGKANLGSLRIGGKARKGKRAGSYFLPIEKREKICKGYSENTLPENVKIQLKAQKEVLPMEMLQISGCAESFPVRSSNYIVSREKPSPPKLLKSNTDNNAETCECAENVNAEPKVLEHSRGPVGQESGGPQKTCFSGNKGTEWKSPKCILIIPFASQEFDDSSEDEKEDVGLVNNPRCMSMESIPSTPADERGTHFEEAKEKSDQKPIESKLKDDLKFKLTTDLIPTHQHNHQNWIVSLYQRHLQEVGFRLPREKVNSASLRSNLKMTSTTKSSADENKDLSPVGTASDKDGGVGGGKIVPKLAYTKGSRTKTGLVYSNDNSIDEPLSESTVVVGKGAGKDSEDLEQATMTDEKVAFEKSAGEHEGNGMGDNKPEMKEQHVKTGVAVNQNGKLPQHQGFVSYGAYRSELIQSGLTGYVVKEQMKKLTVGQKKVNNTTTQEPSHKTARRPVGISLRSHRYAWPSRRVSSSSNSKVVRPLGQTKPAKQGSVFPSPGSAKTSRSWDKLSNSSQQMLPIIGKKLHSRSKSTVN